MRVHKVRQMLASERGDVIISRNTVQTNDGRGVLAYEYVGRTLETSRLVKRPTLLGSLLARVGALPVLPPSKPKGKPGPKPKARGDLASSVKGGMPRTRGIGVENPDESEAETVLKGVEP